MHGVEGAEFLHITPILVFHRKMELACMQFQAKIFSKIVDISFDIENH